MKWYRFAVWQGEAQAQYKLGVMYSKGEGVQKDHIKAYSWTSLSAAQGIKTAISNKPKLTNMMAKEQITEAELLATNCLSNNYKNCD